MTKALLVLLSVLFFMPLQAEIHFIDYGEGWVSDEKTFCNEVEENEF